MSNTVYVLESANLFVGDDDPTRSNHLVIQNVKLPTLEENFNDLIPTGAPIAYEVDSYYTRLECTFALAGWQPNVFELLGSENPQMQHTTIYGVIRDKRTAKPIEVMAVLEGRLSRVDPAEFTRGALQNFTYAIRGISHYELYFDKEELYFWDYWLSQRRVYGNDLNNPTNSILRIPVTSP